jgi:hypothetical protein
MTTLTSPHPQSPPVVASAAAWLAVFLSPTAYFALLILAERWHVPAPPAELVVALFCLIPLVALVVCSRWAWRSGRDRRQQVVRLILTILGMALQCGVLLLIIISAITVAISLP